MNSETVAELTQNLVNASEKVLEMFQSGNHPTEGQLKRLEGALFPFTGQKLCGHKIIDECDCLAQI